MHALQQALRPGQWMPGKAQGQPFRAPPGMVPVAGPFPGAPPASFRAPPGFQPAPGGPRPAFRGPAFQAPPARPAQAAPRPAAFQVAGGV